MAHPKMRANGLGECCLHLTCAAATLVVVYVVGSFVGDAAVVATRYWSG